MGKVRKTKAVKAVADFLFRYMVARYRCVGGALPSSRLQLAADVKQGVHLFERDMAIDAAAWPPVTNDREPHAFFLAIISADDSAKPEIESAELAAWAAGFIWSPRVAGAAIDLRNRIWRQCCLRRSRETNGSADPLL